MAGTQEGSRAVPLLAPGPTDIEPVEEPATPPTIPYTEKAGKPVFTWTDPDGGVWPLSDTSEELGWFTLWPSGWGAAPIELVTDSLAYGGESVRAVVSKAGVLQWPMEIFGRTHDEFLARYRKISRAFTLTTRRQAPGTLSVQRPDGSIREIEAFLTDGLSGESEQNHLYARPVLSLFCPDGKWRDGTAVTVTRTFTPPVGGGGDPITFYTPYLSVISGNVVGDPGEDPGENDEASQTTINNPGDVDAWPIWTITGPMTELRAWNVTIGGRFALTYPLTTGQSITITTGTTPTVRGPGDMNFSEYIDWFNTAGTELWPLTDGDNIVGLQVDGAGATTSVKMLFTPRYDNS